VHAFHNAVSIHLGWTVAILGVLVLAAFVIALIALARSSVVTRRFGRIATGGGEDSLAALLGAVEKNSRGQSELDGRLEQLHAESRRHLKRIGLVKYDAFEGVAGQQSYSLCLLDEEGDGVLLSSLVGTNFTRGYALRIAGGQPERKLGDEESRALEMAVSGAPPGQA